ncbi:hypothetical protein XA68_15601 [Ophiocordyceps unilateralis]|uniref:Pal1 cell morphology protein n=1 Tax=Ophiocordyceps unilateralis TaxID=268505 RepID=A0A2A9P6G6_OPHUN|nr:hypothetical protein XA68_15601 [Ophiocordyceps unilateralis]
MSSSSSSSSSSSPRTPRRRTRAPYTDVIDALDTVGGRYHHAGPYDAALPVRNRDGKYSPLAAVHDSNMEAIRATPRENLIDSLSRHVPLQGVATIPPGGKDMTGNVMHYVEGADLMREPDCSGGAYKRWPGVVYHPDDLKGKGEPSYTDDERPKHKHHLSMPSPSAPHQQSSKVDLRPRANSLVVASSSDDKLLIPDLGVCRSLSTSKARLTGGLMRRLGSVRRKKTPSAATVTPTDLLS